jgi:hypothetical protein
MFLGILTLITALTISAVAIYYSVAGLVAIFAAAALPIIIMGGALEIGKLVTAVWLHRYWHQATWWLKAYLSISVLVLMFITSMGIFGFLSRAHIEQTSNATEGRAQIERINTEIARQEALIARAEQRIEEAEVSVGQGNNAIQEQIDREQERIDNAYSRIQPAIDEQTAIIESARLADARRTEPFEQQLTALDEELRRLDTQAQQIEQRIADLRIDTSAIEPVLAQIANIEESISLVQGQLAGGEQAAIQSAQRTIGVDADGSAGPNTRRAADAWIATQQERLGQLQAQIVEIRMSAQQALETERLRLTNLVTNIRKDQTDAIKARQLEILATIDSVRSTESPVILDARDEIARIRASADAQIAQSNNLIQSLRESLTVGKDLTVEEIIVEQQQKIVESNSTIDTLTEQKYTLQAEYRKLEAEVGPVKYLAEFVYGEEANQDLLEEAVRWVIIIIILVFDPLAVLLLIASQYTFEIHRKERKEAAQFKEKNNETTNRSDNEQSNISIESKGKSNNTELTTDIKDSYIDLDEEIEGDSALLRTGYEGRIDELERTKELEEAEESEEYKNAKQAWKAEHPDQTVKFWKDQYIKGKIDELPWEQYVQNAEQSNNSIWQRIRNRNE